MNNEIKISEEFILQRDLSAMAKKFFVQTEKPLKNSELFIKKAQPLLELRLSLKAKEFTTLNDLSISIYFRTARKLKLKIGTNVVAQLL